MPFTEATGRRSSRPSPVPIATAHRFAATAAPDPELEPQGLRSSAYGLRHCPPRALQPLEERVERKFAHSDRFAFPRTTAPASRSRRTRNASRTGRRVAERERPGRGLHPVGGVDVVLHEHGDPVQRAARPGRAALGVERVGDLERVGVRLEDRPEARVDGLDAFEVRLRDRPRRERARRHGRPELGDRRFLVLERREPAHALPRRLSRACPRRGQSRRAGPRRSRRRAR